MTFSEFKAEAKKYPNFVDASRFGESVSVRYKNGFARFPISRVDKFSEVLANLKFWAGNKESVGQLEMGL